MKYDAYIPEAVCPKCAFPTMQMFRSFYTGTHKDIEGDEVVNCNIKGEHIHLQCVCGNSLTFRPLDWNHKSTSKKVSKIKSKKTS